MLIWPTFCFAFMRGLAFVRLIIRICALAGFVGIILAGSVTSTSAYPAPHTPEAALLSVADPVSPSAPTSEESESVPLLPLDLGEGLSSAQAQLCPSCTCQLTVDNPHQSDTNRRAVNTHTYVKCKTKQPRIRATSDLYRWDLWQWDKVAPRGDKTVLDKNNAKTNAASTDGKCVKGEYRAVGSGYVDQSNGTKLGATDENRKSVACNKPQ
jgi:hypothetical protein